MFGYNSREIFQGATYDIQTQEPAGPGRSIETLVYRNGKIITTIRIACSPDLSPSSFRDEMSRQHEEICANVREGRYELIFLWISRGIIAFESRDYPHALDCFESVMTIDETHAEANAYLDKIRGRLAEEEETRARLFRRYRRQIENLEREGRGIEASRKKAILARLEIPEEPSPSSPKPGPGKAAERSQSWRLVAEKALRLAASWWAAVRSALRPLAARLLSRARESLLSRHALVTASAALLLFLSGILTADLQVQLDPEYHAALARDYLEEDHTDRARTLFYGVLTQAPGSEDALNGLWETFAARGDYQRAVPLLTALAERRESSGRLLFYLAEAQRLCSAPAEAIRTYTRAVEQGAPEVPCKIGTGLCLLALQRPSEAIELWEDLLRKGVEDYRLDYCLGIAYQQRGRFGRASVYYARALKGHPERPAPIYRSLAGCLSRMHQQEKARQLLAKASTLETEQPAAARATYSCQADPGNPPHGNDPGCFPFPLL